MILGLHHIFTKLTSICITTWNLYLPFIKINFFTKTIMTKSYVNIITAGQIKQAIFVHQNKNPKYCNKLVRTNLGGLC